IVAIAGSLLDAVTAPQLFSMTASASPDDVAAVADRAQMPGAPSSAAPGAGGVRNVVLFVMDSVSPDVLDRFGAGTLSITPNLNRYRDRSIVFRDIYATTPAADADAVALLCSSYPWMSSQPLPQARPKIALESI